MRYSSRFFLYGPFLMFVALAAGVMIYWWVAASAFAQRLDALNGHEVAPGIRVSFAARRIAGFPFRLDAIFDNFALQIAGTHGPMTWHADHLATHALTYETSLTVLEAAGKQEIWWEDAAGRRHVFAFVPGALHASAIINGGKLARFDLDTFNLASPKFAAARAQFHLRHDPGADALDLVLDFQSVRFAGDAAAGFTNGLTRARFEGRLSPATAFAALLAGQGDWRAAVANWHKSPGSFKIDEAEFGWGKCQATSAGLVTLDDAHRLSGSLAFGLANCEALAKQAAGVTAPPGAHRAILTALADLASHEPADRSGATPVMLVFRDGLAFLGPGRASGGGFFEPIGFLHAFY
ncbi:MAG: DUF2125 domain-containing protein [Rhizomicrobium sp.]